jgi:hypothetical protein
MATPDVLDALPAFQADLLAHKFVDLYKDPAAGMQYMASPDFAEDILKLCAKGFPKTNGLSKPRLSPLAHAAAGAALLRTEEIALLCRVASLLDANARQQHKLQRRLRKWLLPLCA